jgi:hypothetical protein
MSKKCLSIVFIGLLVFSANLQIVFAQTVADKTVEKIKADVTRRGTGEKSKVVVRLKDGTKLKGYISRTGEDSFDLIDSKTRQSTTVSYDKVTKIKRQGLSTGAKIAIGIGVGAAATIAVLAIVVANVQDNLFDH